MTILLAGLGAVLLVVGFFGMLKGAPRSDGTRHPVAATPLRLRLWLTAMFGVMALGLALIYFAF